jgi:hypothetical protein
VGTSVIGGVGAEVVRIRSYPKVYNLGHAAIRDLLRDPVVVQEKVDGSQFSFMLTQEGELLARSKGQDIVIDNPEKMFGLAIEVVKELRPLLTPGFVYRGEYLKKEKHNALRYNRVPNKHIILFDVQTGDEEYAPPINVESEADRLGLESVPTPLAGMIGLTLDDFKALLDTESVLGGQKIEGVVIKNYYRFGVDGKALMGKYVSEAFKEVHAKEWGAANPSRKDVVQRLIESYRTEPRWQKAVQHLRDRGDITDSPADIGPLMKEVGQDVLAECREEIKDRLFAYAWPQIQRGLTAGLPQWYKDRLMQQQFTHTTEEGSDATQV